MTDLCKKLFTLQMKKTAHEQLYSKQQPEQFVNFLRISKFFTQNRP